MQPIRLSKYVLLPIAILAACAANAQSAFDVNAANVLLLDSPIVLKDLGVSHSQQSRIDKAASESRARMDAYRRQLQEEIAAAKKKGLKKMKVKDKRPEYYKLVKKQMLTILTPAQVTRLGQLSLQRSGMIAILDPVVGKRLGVTPGQEKQLKAAVKEGLDAARKIELDAIGPIQAKYSSMKISSQAEQREMQSRAQAEAKAADTRIQPQIKRIEANTRQHFEAILTSKQKAAWKLLLGKPIKA